jgi:tetratricopeptide (TPR) repeat protein
VVLLERLGLMYRNNDQTQEAVDTFRQIAELDADQAARASAQIIDTYRVAKSLDKALAEADAALKKFPKDRTIRAVRASVLADMGKTDEAVADVKSLLDGKNDRETYITLAQIYEKAKNYNEMAKAIDAAEKLSRAKDEKEAIAFMRGAMYEKLKQYDRAEAEFRKVLELDANNASALNYLGYMLADRNVRLPEALDLIQKALELDPNNGAYLDSLGWVYYRLDDLEKAEQYLERALERFSKDPTIHDHLGDVYFKKGKLKEAIERWQSSLKHWESAAVSESDPAEIAKVQKKLENARVRLAKEARTGAAPQ